MSSLVKRTYPELFIPGQWLNAQEKKRIQSMYKSWRAGLPANYFLQFVKKGLQPFLRAHGYTISPNDQWSAKYLSSWLFSHVQMNRNKQHSLKRTFMQTIHNGGEEEKNEFFISISFEDWEALADMWKCAECFDDSPSGADQRLDLPSFVWNIVDLSNSRRHIEWLERTNYGEDDDTHVYVPTHQDDTAFGGDRRTH
jgi:hypothetical protein